MKKKSLLAIFWSPRKDISPILHLCLVHTLVSFWMLTLKDPLKLAQSGDLVTTVDVKDTFSALTFQSFPGRVEQAPLSCANVRVPEKHTDTLQLHYLPACSIV